LDGRPTDHLRNVLAMDLLRKEVYDRTSKAIEAYRKAYGVEPSWARVSFDLVHRCGEAAYGPHLPTICGLEFRLEMKEADVVEVGSSCRG
jgi:hypothetical protein